MALAVLKYKGIRNENLLFYADIGTAPFFRYVLGEEIKKLKIGRQNSVKVLDGHKKRSRVFRIRNEARLLQGMFPVMIPIAILNDHYKYIQLYSYNRANNVAPTISKILRLPVIRHHKKSNEFVTGLSKTTLVSNTQTMEHIEVKNKANCLEEPSMSKVMFWNTIVGALPGLLKQAAPLLGGLLGRPNGENNSQNTEQRQKSDEITQKVVAILQALANGDGQSQQQSMHTYSSAYSLQPNTLLELQPLLEKILSPEAIEAVGDDAQKLFMAIKDSLQNSDDNPMPNSKMAKTKTLESEEKYPASSQYSEAKVAPALLAALPLIEKALDPKTIEAIGNQPVKLFKAIGDAVLKMDEQEIKHLEAINPGVDSADDIAKLMAGMSLSSSYRNELIQFKMITNLNLDFVGTKTVPFKNKNRILYCKKHQIQIPFKITTDAGTILNKVLPKSVIQIVLRHARTMKIVFRKNIRLIDISMADTISEAFLTPKETQSFPVNTELKMEISYIWKSNKNENIGVLKCHYVYFIDQYAYQGIGEKSQETFAMNDIQLHRKVWHKIWEGGYSDGKRWHLDLDVKYFYSLELENSAMARLATKVKVMEDNAHGQEELPSRRKIRAKIKSGLEWSIEAIQEIMKMQQLPPLDPEIFNTLKNSDLSDDFQWVARQHVSLKGRDGDTGTLWAYPEMALCWIMLSEKGKVDSLGQVTEIYPKKVQLLVPDSIHLIGTKSE